MADQDITTPDPNGGQPTPDPGDDVGKKFAEEAGRWRLKFRGAEEEVATLKAQLAAREDKAKDDDIAPAERLTMEQLQSKLRKAEKQAEDVERLFRADRDKHQGKILGANLRQAVAESKVHEKGIADAVDILKARGARLDDDDRAVIDVKDSDGVSMTVDLTPENIRKYGVLGDHFFPAESRSGSGSQPPRGGTTPVGLDLERAANDQAYFEANHDAIVKYRKEQQRGH